MAKVAWKSAYSVGVPEMDAQHHEIFEHLLNIETAVACKDPWRSIVCQIKLLEASLKHHLADEQGLMAAIGLPEAVEHGHEHSGLVIALADFVRRLRASPAPDEVLVFFEQWFVGHVLGHDVVYGDFIAHEGAAAYAEWKRARGHGRIAA